MGESAAATERGGGTHSVTLGQELQLVGDQDPGLVGQQLHDGLAEESRAHLVVQGGQRVIKD